MKSENINSIIYLCLLILSSALLIFLRYDLTKFSNGVYYDLFGYMPIYSIVMLAIFISLLSIVLVYGKRMMSILGMVLIPFIYVFEVWSNYPNILARDVYLHGQVWEVSTFGNIFSIQYQYPKEYPGFFLMIYIIYQTLGLEDIRFGNLFILYPGLMLGLIICIYIISCKVLKDWKIATLATFIGFNLLQFNRNEFTFLHANTRLYSVVILLMALYMILQCKEGEKEFLALSALATASLTMSHVLFQLVIPLTLMIILVFSLVHGYSVRKDILRNRLLLHAFIVALTLVIIWNTYNYYNYTVKTGARSLFSYLYHMLGLELLLSSALIRESIPPIGVILRNYYKVAIAFMTLMVFIYIVWRLLRKKLSLEEIIIVSFILSIIIVFLSTIFSTSLGNSIDRMLILYPIPLSILFILALSKIIFSRFNIITLHRSQQTSRPIRAHYVLLLILICLAGYLLVHEGSILQAYTQPLDNASIFINSYNVRQHTYLTATSPFDIYYVYFNPNSLLKIIRIDLINSLNDVVDVMLESPENVKVIDIRSMLIWAYRYNDLRRSLSEWNEFVLSNINKHYILIYNNGGYEYVYY
jgi:hypothetical protein